VSGELFKMMTDVDMVHVPYRGLGPAETDLLGGQVGGTHAFKSRRSGARPPKFDRPMGS
jgi:hypothetical protein